MSTDPEEHLLDQSLRDAFRDYHLPPAGHMHVWDQVEERIAALPAPRTGLSYRLVLPLTAALGVGVAVGWLLPRPAAPPVAPAAAPAVHATTWVAPQHAAPSWAAHVGAASTVACAPVHRLASKTAGRNAASHLSVQLPKQAASNPVKPARPSKPIQAEQVARVLPDSATQPTARLTALAPAPLAADSNRENNNLPAPELSTAASALPKEAPAKAASVAPEHATAHPAKTAKQEEVNEKMLYRKPTHRQPERGLGWRRWVTHLSQVVHRIL
ncbi:hypothetical protein [Hymenobacter rubidus]|uniref:hypothetical protein n=1 Tax=Hymenobacter rubidus TaxID=1441626 RepID=UPI00191F68F9|nr:hypothetical protein [Hymenobacter rubidus]